MHAAHPELQCLSEPGEVSELRRALPLAELKPQLVRCWSAGLVIRLMALQASTLAPGPVAELANELAHGRLPELTAQLPACRTFQPATQLAVRLASQVLT